MTKRNLFHGNIATLYIVVVLLTTWLITGILFINPSTGLKFFTLIMFIPALIALIFKKVQRKSLKGFIKNLNVKSLLFGILYPIIFLSFCAIITQIIGIGKFNMNKMLTIKDIITMLITILINLFAAWGEEYGWRGYLLPELTKAKGKTKSTILVGIVWGLYHVPAVFLLAKTTGMSNPLLLCIIQACAAFTFSFPSSYCYYLSGNIIPVLFLHSVWNVVNPRLLGDIYTNKLGIIEGNLLNINGEGILGAIVGAILIWWFIMQFIKMDKTIKFNTGLGKEIEK